MKVGVTGWTGFIGKNLVDHFPEGHEVHLYVGKDLSVDLKTKDFVSECDIIVHLGGRNKGRDKDFVFDNFMASSNLINFCYATRKPIIIAGTDYKNEGAYKASKDAVFYMAKAYQYAGLNSTILKLPKVIGPHCRPNYNSFVTTLIDIAAKGKLNDYLYLIKDMNEQLELIHVADVCDVILDHIERPALMSGFAEYVFGKYDGLITITFKEIVEILNGNQEHKHSKVFLDLLQWYKENDLCKE